MSMGTRYSFSLTTFSPSGKLLQIEYALNAVSQGATTIGIKAANGVVIATEKKMPSLLIEAESVEKVAMLNEATGVTYAGMGPDFKVLLRKGRKAAQAYYRTYLEASPTQETVRELASVMQEYTQSGGVRPFGVSLLVAGCDETGPHLFQVDPSGSYWAWKAAAIGKNYISARKFLEKRYTEDLDLEDAVHTALLTLKDGFDGEMDETNIEVGVVDVETGKFRLLSEDVIREHLGNL
ncbi:proteasome subunit alpha type-2 [Thecamonas trahens ATCC 50062]|uniref:Proteasome subunit alpha type n=1 Tax=Thecamonas trahens ATCC 50062 TaxID=461836 RepID=A0A0L0DA66_THETB|nr:proteasome subunit alpha type-2 [Thecamonas trahens ATCC 50062]KNC49249.1 proteasome subunit alpha type-2 [Thecamonas trahens ATCC 50062]|eukprot:XP_013757963.1 proteasome subunit alpha type-2 [Thecamonas trahens ATCC 50062]